MRILFTTLLILGLSYSGHSQSPASYKSKIKAYQSAENDKFRDQRISPLKKKDLESFNGLKFYRPKPRFKVTAKFIRTTGSEPFEMPTTTDRKPIYEKYGELHFEIKGRKVKLSVYQSHDGRRNPLYRNNLFLPFKDLTNTKRTYGGGRFIDLKIPQNDSLVVDFNQAYNPFCAYNEKYSCPIVPEENHLDIVINAGVKNFKK